MFSYPLFFIIYWATSHLLLQNNQKAFEHFYDFSKNNFVENFNPYYGYVDSSILFPKKITKNLGPSFFESKYLSKFRIKYLIINKTKNISLIPSYKEFNTFEKIINNNRSQHFLLMNAGMFHPNYKSVGLTISNGKLIQPIDTLTNSQSGNFYLYPNGVFLLDTLKNPSILTTQEFLKSKIDLKTLSVATQSGPMLVINNKLHPSFTPNSKNLNIRNGVGVNLNGEVIFAISESEISFYDFATFFKDELKCPNAIYLDGTISEIYYMNNKYINQTSRMTNNKFGPILMVQLGEEKDIK